MPARGRVNGRIRHRATRGPRLARWGRCDGERPRCVSLRPGNGRTSRGGLRLRLAVLRQLRSRCTDTGSSVIGVASRPIVRSRRVRMRGCPKLEGAGAGPQLAHRTCVPHRQKRRGLSGPARLILRAVGSSPWSSVRVLPGPVSLRQSHQLLLSQATCAGQSARQEGINHHVSPFLLLIAARSAARAASRAVALRFTLSDSLNGDRESPSALTFHPQCHAVALPRDSSPLLGSSRFNALSRLAWASVTSGAELGLAPSRHLAHHLLRSVIRRFFAARGPALHHRACPLPASSWRRRGSTFSSVRCHLGGSYAALYRPLTDPVEMVRCIRCSIRP